MTMRDASARQRLSDGLQPAVRSLHRLRRGAAMQRALARATARAPFFAMLVLGFTIAFSPALAIPVWAPVLVLIAVLALFVALGAVVGGAAAVRELEAAAACDRANGTKDRLSAALELAGEDHVRSGLGEAMALAAIEDGVQRLGGVDTARVAGAREPSLPRWRRAVASVVLLLVAVALIPARGALDDRDRDAGGDGAAATAAGEPAARTDVAAAAREPAPGGQPATPSRKPDAPRNAAAPRAELPPPNAAEPTPAMPAASGAAQTSSEEVGDSNQSGAPKAAPSGSPGAGRPGGGQGSSASGAPEPAPEQPKPQPTSKKSKPKAPSKPTPDQEQKPSESAGAPSGPSRGSGKMSAVGNKRQDLNRGMEREDDPDVEDEEIEDESDEQEQRGGVTPMRRQDQRPAARELSISGDGPPDQGRGGPTPPKKSRGTASLVLGLKLPDQVRGQPNPGTAKTSMEQIPPRRQQGDPGIALPAANGRLGTPQSARPVADALLMMLQAYHARLREQDGAPATSSPSSDSSPSPAPATAPTNR